MRKVGKSIKLSWKINKREKKKFKKKGRRENIGNWWIMWWLNKSVVTINTTLQLLNIYRHTFAFVHSNR